MFHRFFSGFIFWGAVFSAQFFFLSFTEVFAKCGCVGTMINEDKRPYLPQPCNVMVRGETGINE